MKRNRANTVVAAAPPARAPALDDNETPTLPGLPDKEYFRIGEAARIVGVKPYVLRYWESEFRRDIRPDRTRSNQRMYRRKDVQTFLEIKRLRYEEKLELPGARRRLRFGGPEEALPDLPDEPGGEETESGAGVATEPTGLAGEEGISIDLDDFSDEGDAPLEAAESGPRRAPARPPGAPLAESQSDELRRGLEELLRIVDEDEKDE